MSLAQSILRVANQLSMSDDVSISRDYQVPEIAGYNGQGTVLYIDERLPEVMSGIPVDKYLEIHELVESTLEFYMPGPDFGYDHAHEIATAAEREALELDGYDWDTYDQEMQKWVRLLENNFDPDRLPPDLVNPNLIQGI